MSLATPVFLVVIVVATSAIYLAGPGHWTRLVPSAMGSVLLLVAWRLARAGKTAAAGTLFAIVLGLSVLVGMTLNGGVRAPIYALGIVVIAYVAWIRGPRAAAWSWVAFVVAGAVFVWLGGHGLLRPAPQATPRMVWILVASYMLLGLVVTAIPNLMLRWALEEAERRREEAEEAGLHIRERETALIESNERFRVAFETSPDAISISRIEDGVYVAVNRGFTESTGYTSEEALGRSALELGIWVDPRERQRFVEVLRERGSVDDFAARFRTKDGGVIFGSLSARVVPLQGGPHFLGVTKDITGRIWAESELQERERRYRLLADNVHDVIWTMNLGLRFTYFSPSIQALRGVTPEEACAQSLEEFLTPDSARLVKTTIAREIRLEQSADADPSRIVRLELEEYRKDGSTIWVEAQVSFLRDARGRAVGILGVSRDVTERLRVERSLRESEQRYRSLFESAGDAILIVRDGRFVDCNARSLEIFGRAREEIVGHRAEELSPPVQPDGRDSAEAARERIRAAVEGGAQRFEWLHLRKGGAAFLAEVSLSQIRLEGVPQVLAIVRDVSERKALEKRLAQTQRMEAIGALAGGIAHDFNNVLSIMTGYTEVALLRLPPEGPATGSLEQVLAAGERARQLVGQILTFSRMREERPVPCALGPIVKETVRFLRSSLPATIEVREHYSPARPVVVDPSQVHQVVMNLCANAFHAMESGGELEVRLAEVELGAAEAAELRLAAGPYALLTVADTGGGIPEEIRDRVFEPYFTTKEAGKGTGLGLAVVHGAVTKAGGQIRLLSEPGAGSTFHVYLPIALAAAPAEASASPRRAPGGTERILVVDDEPLIATMTREVLEDLGYAVTAMTDSREALARFRERPEAFDLVLTDLTMPKLDGEGLTRGLRAARTDIPVIVSTGFREHITAEQARDLDVAEVLTKPVRREHLAAAVRRTLDHAAAAPAPQ